MITDRPYVEPQSGPIEFFIGREVEHTPTFGLTTLFVVGLPDIDKISKQLAEHPCEAIYFGANQSFEPSHHFVQAVRYFIEQGYWCTLDFDVAHCQWVSYMDVADHERFVPMISVKIPRVNRFNQNTTVKVDDINFAATNPGVWCHSLHSLIKRDMMFTDWQAYQDDVVIDKDTK